MRLSTPLGLLGLIGIILLILIYILKPKYQDKSISSTFVWKLSLKYKKQKIPFQWLKSSLLVILQFLILGILIFSLTTPLIELDSHSGEKIIILDASANMLADSDGITRFERAIKEIGVLADTTTPDDRFTVILAGKEASFIARRLDSAQYIKELLSELSGTYENADIDVALKLTEGVLAENPNAEIILFTGNKYSETGVIQVRDMSNDEWNVSILDFSSKLSDGYYDFQAEIASYNRDIDCKVSLYIDGEYRDVKVVEASDNETIIVDFKELNILEYSRAEVIVDYDDNFSYDNRFPIFGWENEIFTVQLVSESPRFIQSALLTLGNFNINVPIGLGDDSDFPILYEGYDLYIFDGIQPEHMPVDGTVWIINPIVMPEDTELLLGDTLSGGFTLSAPNHMSKEEQEILKSISPSNITVSSYTYLTNYDSYDAILMNDQDPVVLVKDIDGQKLVLFAFDLHNSNLPIIPEFILLMYNLSQYSVQNMINQNLFYPGDTIEVYKKTAALYTTISSKDGDIQYDDFPLRLIAQKPGEYSITQTLASGEEATKDYFIRVDRSQSDFDYDYGVLSDPNTPTEAQNVNRDTIDIIAYLTGVLMLLMIIEWGLHYNEHN
ncbi:hypothetical protein KQ51_00144 [Candidatus Izimaplasma bacterium HR1]|jgi:hypothetical protein|uniref:vWA domain-containing protein n=1 Tax=Candidatus Izimoplasma sp. HR1 TaxID=1541959 RepID=UPI0004F875D2|nr:hypothetical protein KQ51_00144 [Candidatus Izimaplasma bacterium HR1]